jgi:lysophospholipase L1-like esterase
MQAMNGAGGLGVRRFCRLLGCVAALAALSAMTVPSIAAAKTPKVNRTYLALGDSLAFGYSQQLFNENEKTFENPAAFEHGYASDYYNALNTKGKLAFVNDGCPGETTGSLIGNGPLLAKIQAAVPGATGEAACAYHYADGLPLHNEYGGTSSQLESAIATINAARQAGKPVKAITIDIGANDQLHFVHRIEVEVEGKITERVTALAEAQATGEIADKVKAAAEKEVEEYVIEQVIPQAYVESGGVPPTFEEDIAKDAGEYAAAHAAEDTALVFQDEGEYEYAHGAELAAEGAKLGAEDGAKYVAEHGAELKAEGTTLADGLIAAGAGELDTEIITNVTGIFTALTNPAVDGSEFTGKLIFEGTYNSYGNDYGTGELLAGSNALVKALNGAEKATFSKHPLKACYVNAQALFNTESQPSEAEHMEEWTNMANFTKFEGKANGPDIHATPLGYEKMAEQIKSTCKF